MLRCRIKLFYAATKLRYFSDFKLGVSIPVRGESSELLNVDGEKNDYDWWVMVSYLKTFYDTIIFVSLVNIIFKFLTKRNLFLGHSPLVSSGFNLSWLKIQASRCTS